MSLEENVSLTKRVDLGERRSSELTEKRTPPLWPRGESVLCACLSQGQPLSVQYMPATFTRTRVEHARPSDRGLQGVLTIPRYWIIRGKALITLERAADKFL